MNVLYIPPHLKKDSKSDYSTSNDVLSKNKHATLNNTLLFSRNNFQNSECLFVYNKIVRGCKDYTPHL